MLFTDVLNETGLTADTVSAGLKTKIKHYNKYASAVAEAKEKLKTASDKVKIQLEQEITHGEEVMANMNEEISAGIKKFHENELNGTNEKKKNNLAAARNNKGAVKTKDGVVTPIVSANGVPAVTKAAEEVVVEEVVEEKKKSNIGGIIAGVLFAGVLGFFGWKAYKGTQEN